MLYFYTYDFIHNIRLSPKDEHKNSIVIEMPIIIIIDAILSIDIRRMDNENTYSNSESPDK